MLNVKKIPARNYEQLMEEQRGRIPVYCREWTNYNPSDPGITILENLTGVHLLLQTQIDEMPDAVKEKLLELLGYAPQKECCARLLLEPETDGEALLIPAGQPFALQDIVYETETQQKIPAGRITGIFAEDEEGMHDYSFLLQRELIFQAYAFGRQPKAGACLYFVMDVPLMPGEEAVLHISVAGQEKRNPFPEADWPIFGQVRWECYTKAGFVSVAMQDATRGFVQDGTLRWTQPCRPARYEKGKLSGYVWRAVLQESWYDMPPLLRHVTGFLFSAVQRETMAAVYSFRGASCVTPGCLLSEDGGVCVFCREPGERGYRRYTEWAGQPEPGRYYHRERETDGRDAFRFDGQLFGYGPDMEADAVKIVVYTKEMVKRYDLGRIYGYDGQEIRLPMGHVSAERFCVIAEREACGGRIYDFLEPGRSGCGVFSYVLHGEEGRLTVSDPGDYIGARLYAGSFAVTMGEAGNVRAGNVFTAVGMEGILFRNPVPGTGGRLRESTKQLRKRFASDLDKPWAAALPADYETLAAMTPGLCIGKVHAWTADERSEVWVAVMPALPEKFPQLSAVYRNVLEQRLENRRLLSVRVRVCAPLYIPVSVSGVVYVKPHYEKCREKIEETAAGELDYRNGPQRFGAPLLFHRLFRSLEVLECVDSIADLAIIPESGEGAVLDGRDIRPVPNGLLFPGSIKFEILQSPGEPS